MTRTTTIKYPCGCIYEFIQGKGEHDHTYFAKVCPIHEQYVKVTES